MDPLSAMAWRAAPLRRHSSAGRNRLRHCWRWRPQARWARRSRADGSVADAQKSGVALRLADRRSRSSPQCRLSRDDQPWIHVGSGCTADESSTPKIIPTNRRLRGRCRRELAEMRLAGVGDRNVKANIRSALAPVNTMGSKGAASLST